MLLAMQAVLAANTVHVGGYQYPGVFALPIVFLAVGAYVGVALTRGFDRRRR